MSQELKIAFVSSEVRPFAVTGGLGDVAASLPKELRKMGHDVRLIMPGYALVESQGYALEELPGLDHPIPLPNIGTMTVQTATLPGSDLPVYFLAALDQDYYRRTQRHDQIYGWPDDARRFIFLCRGALELCNAMAWKPDVIHCNDWQTGLIPAYLDSVYKYDFLRTSTLYTVHNLLYSGPGELAAETSREAGLGTELLPFVHPYEYYGHFNFAKGALLLADVVNAVSPTYAEEVLQPESEPLPCVVKIRQETQVLSHRCRIPNGVGFYAVLRHRRQTKPFLGILNGIDADYWNPQTDVYLALPVLRALAKALPEPVVVEDLAFAALSYGASDSDERIAERKALHKQRLQRLCGLPLDENALVIGRVARIGDQKDYLLMAEDARAIRALLDMPCQLIVLGRAAAQDVAGQWYKQEYARYDKEQPDQLCFINSRWERWTGQPLPPDADFEFEHLIYAGSDAFLVPSLYEPSGLTQLVSFRYGTVPIVRRTGGLADSVRDFQEPPSPVKGAGFLFAEPSPDALIEAVRRAVQTYQQRRPAWRHIIRDGLEKDFSWAASARQYAEAYRLAIEVKRGKI